MARRVDYLNRAQIVVYKSAYDLQEDDWQDFQNDIIESLKNIAPSLEECDCWDGRETHILLENGLAEVGISEYNGLVSISIRPKEESYEGKWIEPLAKKWIESIESKFEKTGDLARIGTFSNGESMFKHKTNNDTFSSKEGHCDWA